MKKTILLIITSLICLNGFSFEFKDIKDIEKIRWIDCGEDNPEWSKIEEIRINFYMAPAKQWYKALKSYNTTVNWGEPVQITYGQSYIINNWNDTYYGVNATGNRYTTDYYESLLKNKPKLQKTVSTSYFDLQTEYQREDNKKFDLNNLPGLYKEINSSDNHEIVIREIKENKYAGTVFISDYNTQLTHEYGYHLIKWNDERKCLESDKTVGKVIKNNQIIYNDDFSIKIVFWDNNRKLILLKTDSYTRPFVPMEDFFTPKTDSVTFCNDNYYGVPFDIHVYSKPDFNSEVLFTSKCNEYHYAKVIESEENMHKEKGVISKWVKIRFKNKNVEGWVWGADLQLGSYTEGLDLQKILRYVDYNTVKK